ncbi:MAG TPA: BNR-4 repeat-containing protein [Lacipirellulaceae bacterium]
MAINCAAADFAIAAPAEVAPGYRGIWYMNQPTGDPYRYKYSGGLGTYPQQHAPIAIYSAAANKSFFCYGGTTGKTRELACMVSYFDHDTGTVPRPRILLVKLTGDAHENPTLQIDEAGHLWIFCNTHGPAENSYIFRSRLPYSIDEYERVARTNFSYSQPWHAHASGFMFLHTRYTSGRRLLHWMTSADGREWSASAQLAAIEQGHYQISSQNGRRIATAFNFHPKRGGLNARTNLYYLETADMGATWCTATGDIVTTPLTEVRNPALVEDFEAEGKLVYLKDISFDIAGRPVILFLCSQGYAPGPAAGERIWFTAHWTGDKWVRRRFAASDHNYDFGSLYIDDGRWQIIAPTDAGPQPGMTGGEMVLWISRDEGRTWTKQKQLTQNSQLNHTYSRRPVDAHPEFYALWADGNPLERSESRLYFTDREGSQVWRLPVQMEGDFAKPEIAW